MDNEQKTLRLLPPTTSIMFLPTPQVSEWLFDRYKEFCEPKTVFYIPVTDRNGIPKDKSLRAVKGSKGYETMVDNGVDFSKKVTIIENQSLPLYHK